MAENRRNTTFVQEASTSKGQEIIGTFNPSSESDVDLIKQKAIELVNLIEEKGKDPRRKAASITQIELGTMMAVKSLFH